MGRILTIFLSGITVASPMSTTLAAIIITAVSQLKNIRFTYIYPAVNTLFNSQAHINAPPKHTMQGITASSIDSNINILNISLLLAPSALSIPISFFWFLMLTDIRLITKSNNKIESAQLSPTNISPNCPHVSSKP